jgi:hypothetical protein
MNFNKQQKNNNLINNAFQCTILVALEHLLPTHFTFTKKLNELAYFLFLYYFPLIICLQSSIIAFCMSVVIQIQVSLTALAACKKNDFFKYIIL